MLESRSYCKTVVVNSDILVVGGYNDAGKISVSVENFFNKDNSWCHKIVAEVCNEYQTNMVTYYTETCEWKFIDCDIWKNKSRVSFVKYHQ